MTIDDFDEINRLFEKALREPVDRRAEFVEKACAGQDQLKARVLELLRATEDGSQFETAGGIGEASWSALADSLLKLGAGDEVGRYRIVEQIGRGGMAVVFRAERTDGVFDHQVALKVMRPTPLNDVYEQRFERERQILAYLRHPNIAQIYDGGTTEASQPFFAMELVEGLPIDEHCERAMLGVRERIGLLLQLIDALKAAHQQLIVHRDLKPSNVLVSEEGHVKLLDFGIAKVLEDGIQERGATAVGLRMLTPEYASPEQMRGEPVSTATDVYQLGGLAYLVLAGVPPFDLRSSTPEQMHRVVCDQLPLRPSDAVLLRSSSDETQGELPPSIRSASRWAKRLSGDLDAVLLKALEKEPSLRYGSVQQFGEDLERHLEGRAVRARSGGWAYRSARWLRAHKSLVAVVLAVVLYAVSVTWLSSRWSDQRDAARESLKRAETATEFLVGILSEANPGTAGEGALSAVDLLRRVPDRIDQRVKSDPELEALVRLTAGRVLAASGEYELGREQLETVADLTSKDARSGHQFTRGSRDRAQLWAEAELAIADVEIALRSESAALERLLNIESSLAEHKSSWPNQSALQSRLFELRSRALSASGRRADAVEPAQQAVQQLASLGSGHSRELLRAQATLANALRLAGGRAVEALEALEESYAAHVEYYGADHPALLKPLRALAGALGSRGFRALEQDPEASQRDFQRVEELLELGRTLAARHYPERRFDEANFFELRGALDFARERWTLAEQAYSQARSIHLEVVGGEGQAASNLMFVGRALMERGELRAAEVQLLRAASEASSAVGETHRISANIQFSLGDVLLRSEQPRRAQLHYRACVATHEALGNGMGRRAHQARLGLAAALLAINQTDDESAEAATRLREVTDLYRNAQLDSDDPRWQQLASLTEGREH